ncbi:DNA polymerase I [Aminivibrio sp.]
MDTKDVSSLKEKKLLLVDGHGLAFRAFYALPPLSGPDGTPTNALVGFLNMFAKIRDEWKPDLCGVVFDAPGPTHRHLAFKEYKAGRKPTPEEFKTQLPILIELLQALGIPVIRRDGVEADDVLASVACTAAAQSMETLILSSDKDVLQILAPHLSVLRPKTGISSFQMVDEESFTKDFGFPPPLMTDYLALLGDVSDNVPGMPGVGEKTAKNLISRYGSLEKIHENLDELKPALRKKFSDGFEQALISRDLIRLLCETKEDLGEYEPREGDLERFQALCQSLGMHRIAEKFAPGTPGSSGASPSEEAPLPEGRKEKREDLLKKDRLAFLPRIEGKYPLSLRIEDFILAGEDGGYASFPGSEAEQVLKEFSGSKIIMADFKEAAACLGPDFFSGMRVGDFKSAHYLLHPDKTLHLPEAVSPEYPLLPPKEQGIVLLKEYRRLESSLAACDGLPALLEEVDLPLIPVLVNMEQYGIGCDPGSYGTLEDDLSGRLGEIEEEIASKAGERVNLNSPKQVGWLLFEKLGLPAGKTTKTGYSTDVSVLEGLAALGKPFDEVPLLLLEYRELSKMLSGFVQPLVKSALTGEGLIHSTFEPAVTGTGRLSSRDPNLQNLPSFGEWSRRIKEGLRPHGEGRIFVSADYSQIELRVLAHVSGEERLKEAFAAGRDIHRETASWVFGTEAPLVTPELRRIAKMINFGLLYGMSSFGLAQRLAIGRQEASSIIKRYFEALPGVKGYLENSFEEAKKRGYTRTLRGRIRPLAEVSVSPRDRDGLRRIAVNTPLQGTAADIARKAMVDFEAFYPASGGVRLVLQVHDSLVRECPAEDADVGRWNLRRIMEGAASLSVPLKVESKKGVNLSEV